MKNTLIERLPQLAVCENELNAALAAIIRTYEQGGKVLVCGNGGSAADADHIVGELMKGFLKKRPLSAERRAALQANCPSLEADTLDNLQEGLPAVSLCSAAALTTAVANDNDPALIFAQTVMAMGKPQDLLIGISTSGNAKNVAAALKVAKGLGLTTVSLTGEGGGTAATIADIAIRVPERETYKVQELHLPVYHWLCAETEAHFFEI